MKIHFLGTGAADWNGLDERGEWRRMTSTLFDGELLIDLTEEVLSQIPRGVHVKHIFITHSHDDHFSPEAVARLKPERLYVHESWAKEVILSGVDVVPLHVGEWVHTDTFDVLPMPANHSTARTHETPLHYVLRRDGRDFLYATDGAWLLNQELKLMKGMTLCGMAIDATIGDGHAGDFRVFEHNSLDMVRIMVETMRHTGLLEDDAPVFLTHMARTLHPTQTEMMRAICRPLIPCFDGMCVTI